MQHHEKGRVVVDDLLYGKMNEIFAFERDVRFLTYAAKEEMPCLQKPSIKK